MLGTGEHTYESVKFAQLPSCAMDDELLATWARLLPEEMGCTMLCLHLPCSNRPLRPEPTFCLTQNRRDVRAGTAKKQVCMCRRSVGCVVHKDHGGLLMSLG